jgi:hypothetical protein
MTNKTISLCFELEADEIDVFVLKKSLTEHPGAVMWLRHRLAQAIEKVVEDAQDGGVWRFEVTGGEVRDA